MFHIINSINHINELPFTAVVATIVKLVSELFKGNVHQSYRVKKNYQTIHISDFGTEHLGTAEIESAGRERTEHLVII